MVTNPWNSLKHCQRVIYSGEHHWMLTVIPSVDQSQLKLDYRTPGGLLEIVTIELSKEEKELTSNSRTSKTFLWSHLFLSNHLVSFNETGNNYSILHSTIPQFPSKNLTAILACQITQIKDNLFKQKHFSYLCY